MLTWTREADGWHADGFLITLVEPFRWELSRVVDDETDSSVSVVHEPLATARSLSVCKREAELLADADERHDVQRRKLIQIALALCGLVLMGGVDSLFTVIVSLGLIVVILRGLGALIETVTQRLNLGSPEIFYQ